jgi:ADP-heptose:LPS heptosyltransferase
VAGPYDWRTVPNVTVVRAGALGDFIVTLPALRWLTVGGRRVRLVGNRAVADELAADLLVERVSIDEASWAGLFADGLLDPPTPGAAIVLLRDPECAERLMRRGWGPVLWAAPTPIAGSDEHVVDHLLQAVRPAIRDHAVEPAADPAIVPDPRSVAAAWRLLAAVGIRRPYAVIHPGSGSQRKDWPVSRFAAAATVWHAEGLKIAIVAGPADERSAGQLKGLLGASAALLPTQRLSVLAAVLAESSAYLGNDSGVSHLAAAVGAPTIAVFGPTRAARWRPRGRRAVAIEPAERCALCRLADDRPADCLCIEQVTPDMVLSAARELAA